MGTGNKVWMSRDFNERSKREDGCNNLYGIQDSQLKTILTSLQFNPA